MVTQMVMQMVIQMVIQMVTQMARLISDYGDAHTDGFSGLRNFVHDTSTPLLHEPNP